MAEGSSDGFSFPNDVGDEVIPRIWDCLRPAMDQLDPTDKVKLLRVLWPLVSQVERESALRLIPPPPDPPPPEQEVPSENESASSSSSALSADSSSGDADGEDDSSANDSEEEFTPGSSARKRGKKKATDRVVAMQKRSKTHGPQESTINLRPQAMDVPSLLDEAENAVEQVEESHPVASERRVQEHAEQEEQEDQEENINHGGLRKRNRSGALNDLESAEHDPEITHQQTPGKQPCVEQPLSNHSASGEEAATISTPAGRRSARRMSTSPLTPKVAAPDKAGVKSLEAELGKAFKDSHNGLAWEFVTGPYIDEVIGSAPFEELDKQKSALLEELQKKHPAQGSALTDFVAGDTLHVALGKLQRLEGLLIFSTKELRSRSGNQKSLKFDLALEFAKQYSSDRSVQVVRHTRLGLDDCKVKDFLQDPNPYLSTLCAVELEREDNLRIAKYTFDTYLAVAWSHLGKDNAERIARLNAFEALPRYDSYWLERRRRGNLLLKYPALAYQSVLLLDSLPKPWTIAQISQAMESSQTLIQAHDELVEKYPLILKFSGEFYADDKDEENVSDSAVLGPHHTS